MFVDVSAVFACHPTVELERDLTAAKIPWARVNDVPSVAKLPAIASKLTRTCMPDGRRINLQPVPVDSDAPPRELSFPPAYGEHTCSILAEIGFGATEIQELLTDGVAFAPAAA